MKGTAVRKVEGTAGGRVEKVTVEFQDRHLRHAKWMLLRSC